MLQLTSSEIKYKNEFLAECRNHPPVSCDGNSEMPFEPMVECEETTGQWISEEAKEGKKCTCGQYLLYNYMTGNYFPCLCKGRSCRRVKCRELYAKKTAELFNGIITMNNMYVFVTLTLDRVIWPSPEKAWDEIWHIWDKLKKRLKRVYPAIKILAVLEKHPGSEYPHIHFASNQFIPVDQEHCRAGERPLTDLWREVGGGTIVWAKWIKEGLSEYLSKQARISQYTSKDFCTIGDYVKPRRRVWNCSRGLLRPVRTPNKEVKFLHGYQVWDKYGNKNLTEEEINRIIDGVTFNLIGKEFYGQERQIGANMETTFSQVPTRCSEECFPVLEAYRRERSRYEAGKAIEGTKVEDQRTNQKVERQLSFNFDKEG